MPSNRQRRTRLKINKPKQQSKQLTASHSNDTPNPILDIRLPEALNTSEGILQLQRTIGNRAVQKLLKNQSSADVPIQRSPDEKADRPWKPPEVFEPGGSAIVRKDAMWGVLIMNDKMEDVKRALNAETDADIIGKLNSAVKAGHTMYRELVKSGDFDGDLTKGEVGQLEFFGLLIQDTYKEGLSTVRYRAKREIAPLMKGPDTEKLDSVKKDLAEKLHSAFIQGQTGSTISNIGEAFNQIEEYKKSADDVVKWAKQISDHIQWANASELLDTVGKKSKALGEGLGKVKKVISTAESLETLFGDSKTSDVHDGINRMNATLDLIDTTMTFAKAVPLLGALWSNYYAPLTRAILKQLAEIANMKDKEGRQWAQYEWMVKQKRGSRDGQPPMIPNNLMQYFPGGQPVFSFMYRVMNGDSPKVTSTVEKYFAARGDLFNAPIKKDYKKLETDSSTWYNPFDNDDEAPELASWVQSNKDMVWAQLYGSLPSDL